MRILSIHAKSFSYDVVKPAIEEPEELKGEEKKNFENVLVLFVTIESQDNESTVIQALSEIENLVLQIKPSELLIYPYAHLSSDLAPPSKAIELLNRLYEEASKKLNIPVYKAPLAGINHLN